MSMMNLRSLFARAALMAGVASLAACGGGGSDPAPAPAPQVIGSPNPKPTAPATVCSAAGIAAAKLTTNAAVCMLTSDGEIVFELRADKAPVSVANFLKYVKDGFYSNTIIHRIFKEPGQTVVQGGGFATGHVAKSATYPAIALESQNGLSNLRGTLGMARQTGPNTGTSQFYINISNNSVAFDFKAAVPPATVPYDGYAVFGQVIYGLESADKIYAEPVLNAAREVPAVEVLIYWAQQIQ